MTVPTQETTVAMPRPMVKRRRKSPWKRIIALLLVLALAGSGGYYLWQYLNQTEEVESSIQTGYAMYGSIASTVQGSGNARAKASAALTLPQGGIVQEVLVSAGDVVMEGQPLYTIFSQAAYDEIALKEEAVRTAQERVQETLDDVESAQDRVTEAQKAVTRAEEGVVDAQEGVTEAEEAVADAQAVITDLEEDIAELEESKTTLVLTAPFSGKLMEVEVPTLGAQVSDGQSVATLVDDSVLHLSLYFSYAYEASIYVGQPVTVFLPSVMGDFQGTVQEIRWVEYITAEGAKHFEVVVAFDNPGTLTQGMEASASLVAGDGTPIYPYGTGTLDFCRSQALLTDASGPLLSHNLLRYGKVTEGQVLLTLGPDDIDDKIADKESDIDNAQDRVDQAKDGVTTAKEGVTSAKEAVTEAEKNVTSVAEGVTSAEKTVTEAQTAVVKAQEEVVVAQEALSKFNAVAPIDGTVTTCSLVEGAEVNSGDTVLIISNNTTMLVEITVDDRNISFIKPGMTVDLSDWNGNMFFGTVTSINTGDAQMGTGMTEFPVTLTVDNYGGQLLEGVWLDYSFIASQSDNCVLVPSQSVKQISDEEGNISTVVFVKADAPPENALDWEAPPVEPGQVPVYPTVEEGYYPVPVTTGIPDNYNVEIKEGLNGDEVIFLNYFVEQAYSW